MPFKRFIWISGFLLVVALSGYAQEKKTETVKKVDPPKELKEGVQASAKEGVQASAKEEIKAVPITNKNGEAMRLRTRKATMQQMHKINTATRKQMTVRRRR